MPNRAERRRYLHPQHASLATPSITIPRHLANRKAAHKLKDNINGKEINNEAAQSNNAT